MGQQQLLLVILVTIIVGIATVVAINVFGNAAGNANETAVRQDLATIAAAAQGYYMKPTVMGGGGNSYSNIAWAELGGIPCNDNGEAEDASADDGVCTNANGAYDITTSNLDDLTIEGTAATAEDDAGNALVLTATLDGDELIGISASP